MKRILAGFIMDGKAGGVDKYLLTFLKTVKAQKEPIKIDFLTSEINAVLCNDLKVYDSKLLAIPSLRHPLRQYRQVQQIIKEGQYDLVYLNISTAIDCIAAFAARKMNVKEVVIHSHSSGNDCDNSIQRIIYNIIHRICRLFLYRSGTRYCGCSKKAGLWLFPKRIVNSEKFEMIYNAVDRQHFVYNAELRRTVRQELRMENNLVIGHVGNFRYAKNYPFLIDIFIEIKKKNKDAVLLLVGAGVEMDAVKARVVEAHVEDSVRFLGWCRDTNRLYHGMDVFLLPSRFEGLPIAGIEAQCTKVMCVFSDSITEEAKIQDHCYFVDSRSDAEKWAEFILKNSDYKRELVHLLDAANQYSLENLNCQLRELVCH